jgi:hypothetical protein
VVPWLTELAPTEDGRRRRPASSGAQVARVDRVLGPGPAQWAVEVGYEVAQRVASEIPSHVADGGFDVLRMGTESTTLQLLTALAGSGPEAAVTVEALGGIPDFVRRRVGLDDLLRGIQLGHAVIAADVLAECARRGAPSERHEEMRLLSQRMFAFFDGFSTQMAAYYREEEERWSRSESASRLAVVEELLRGRGPGVEAASRRLRYDLGRTHVGLIAWSSARTLDTDQDALERATSALLRDAGCDQRLVLGAGAGVVWAWASRRSGDDVVDLLASGALPPTMHAVLGGVGRGIDGFRSSHADAQAAFALRAAASAPPSVTPYRDVDVVSLLLADPDRAVRFARSELRGLAADDPFTAELRRTLAVYLAEGRSPQLAGERLTVSRNTVTYRVRRAEELLGTPIGVRLLQRQAALAILAEAPRAQP